MNCQSLHPLIDALVDDELDAAHAAQAESHLADCPRCAALLYNHRSLAASLKNPALRFIAPPALRARLTTQSNQSPRYRFLKPLAIAASLLLALTLGWSLRALTPSTSTTLPLAQSIVAAHLRALQADHLQDVASSDKHTVKPWLSAHLDFSPPVPDPDPANFPLLGGRLDYLDNHPVAALVYRHHNHLIDLFLWPDAGPDTPPTSTTDPRGYTLTTFRKNAFTYHLISDTSPHELTPFLQKLTQ